LPAPFYSVYAKQQTGQLIDCVPVLTAEWLQAHAPAHDPASKKTGKGKEPGKKGAGSEVLADLNNQPSGTKRQSRMCTRKTSQTDKSPHQPALPEVQGFSDGGQLSHSLFTV